MRTVSPKMLRFLGQLNNNGQAWRSPSNPTLCALQRRGFAEYHYTNQTGGLWTITPEGREYLRSLKRP